MLVGQPPLSLDIAPPPVVGTTSHAPPLPQRLPVAKLLFTTSQPSVLLSIRDMGDFVRDCECMRSSSLPPSSSRGAPLPLLLSR